MDVMAIVAMQGVVDDKMLILLSTVSRSIVTGLARRQAIRRRVQILKDFLLRQAVLDRRRVNHSIRRLEDANLRLQSINNSRNYTLQALAFVCGCTNLEQARGTAHVGLRRALHRPATVTEILRWSVRHSQHLLRQRERDVDDDAADDESSGDDSNETEQ